MSILTSWKTWLFGLLSWLIPFVASVGFFDSAGNLLIPQPLFKSLMIVIGGSVGVVLLVLLFRRSAVSPVSGVLVGIVWLTINLLLDILVLVPMSGSTIPEYFQDIGLRYFLIPVIATGMAMVSADRT